jgi:Mrp family chromosome partitioning ATPase
MITLTQDAASASMWRRLQGGMVAEEYYSLVYLLRPVGDAPAAAYKTVGVTSCAASAGVSTVAANLAIAAAHASDEPVLLLNLSGTPNLLGGRFVSRQNLGLREALECGGGLGACAEASSIPNLSVLSVSEPGNPVALSMDGRRVHELLRAVEHDFGFVVVDLPTTDSGLCLAAAACVDGILLVLESERTNSEAAHRAKQRLSYANAKLLGVVFNKHCEHVPKWLDSRL